MVNSKNNFCHQPTVIELEDPAVQIKQEIPEAVLQEPEGTSWKSKNLETHNLISDV